MGVEPERQPRRRSLAAVALIRRSHQGQTEFLSQWNPKWQALHFISGHKRPDESFRECLIREMGEELGLSIGGDYTVADQPISQLQFDAWSESAQAMTSYEFAVYEVTLNGGSTLAKVAANPDNRWVTEDEIRAGRCADGTRISPTMARVLMALAPDRT
jgi:hypothetical protein